MASPVLPRRYAGSFVFVLAATGLSICCWLRGIDYLLPTWPLSDSVPIIEQVDAFRGHRPPPTEHGGVAFYPELLSRATALIFRDPEAAPRPTTLDQLLDRASATWTQVRIVSVLLSALIVPATWLLARCFLSRHASALAVGLISTSLLLAVFNAQEKPHGALAAFATLAMASAVWARRRGSWPAYLSLGLCVALAFGSLHSGAATLLLIPAAVLLRDRETSRFRPLATAAALLFVGASLQCFYPTRPDQGGIEPAGAGMRLSGHVIHPDHFDLGGFAVVLDTLASYDPALLMGLVLACVACFLELRSSGSTQGASRDRMVVATFALPYLLFIGSYASTVERFVLPLQACFACLAAWGITRVLGRFAWAGWALPVLAIVPVWHLGSVRAAPSTPELAAQWLAKNVDSAADTILSIPYVGLPLLHAPSALAENARHRGRSAWVDYQVDHEPLEESIPRFKLLISPGSAKETRSALATDPDLYFRRHDARYVAVIVPSPSFTSVLHDVQKSLMASGQRVARFAPEDGDLDGAASLLYRHINDPRGRPFFLFDLAADRMGPTIEVYCLRRAGREESALAPLPR